MTPKVYETTVEYNEDFDEYFLTLPDELVQSIGWEEGNVVEWRVNKDGSVSLEKVDEFFDESEEND
jgi:bifunctional DNA-binding transcriptional regulator/antitoxin component of YhaV-PrlF toxin-antitoxin module